MLVSSLAFALWVAPPGWAQSPGSTAPGMDQPNAKGNSGPAWKPTIQLSPSEPSEPLKRYREGRLSIADFSMTPPRERNQLDAVVSTQLRIHFRYECRIGRSTRYPKAVANLSSVDVFAVMHPEQSWIVKPDDTRLLDHEQGHFDVAQIVALSARLHMHQCWKNGDFKAVGATPDEVIEALRKRIAAELQPYYRELESRQKEYDNITWHGRKRTAQRGEREKQQALLRELNQKWQDSPWHGRQSPRHTQRDASDSAAPTSQTPYKEPRPQ